MKKTNEKFDLLSNNAVKSVVSSLLCIVGGIFVGFIVLLLLAIFTPEIPISDAFKGLTIILGGPFASGKGGDVMFMIGEMLFEATPLLLTGLSVAIAFKTGLFNIGAPGQYLMGTMTSIVVALSVKSTGAGGILVWLLAFLAGTLSGVIWGAIPGIFKAIFGVNEVIVCIMTNWISANIVSWVFKQNGQFINSAGGKSAYTLKTFTNNVQTPKLGLDKLFTGSNIDIGIFIAVLVAVAMYILMNKTTFGYELKACGSNREGARYAGMSAKRNIILSMAIAGGLSAMGAALCYLNGNIEFAWDTYSRLPDVGFNGIPAALLANNNSLGVILSSVFLRYIDKGGFNLAGYTMYNEYVCDLIIAVIIYFAGFAKLIQMLLGGKKKDFKKIPDKPIIIPAEKENTAKEGDKQ
ncbi:MAG: ABC transporter permease [Clostridia bacterium]|nr:ABC transporter permease [Clostridia bacterium]